TLLLYDARPSALVSVCCFFFQAEDGIRDFHVTGVQRVLFRSGPQRSRATGPFTERAADSTRALAVRHLAAQPRRTGSRAAERGRSEERRVGKECIPGGGPER